MTSDQSAFKLVKSRESRALSEDMMDILNRKRRLAVYCFASLIALAPATSRAQSDTSLITGHSADGVLSTARLFGSAAISRQPSGDPLIAGRIEGVPYTLRFLNCANREACEDINFRVGFQAKPSPDIINAWNATKRFSRAFLDAEGDAILEMDVIINGGVSQQMLNSSFEYWRLSLSQFTQHIGFQ